MTARVALIMAGGTGGHVFPALAVARVLRERGMHPVWLGTMRGMESKLVPQHHIELEWIEVGGVRGKGMTTMLRAPFVLTRAVWQAIRIIHKRKPLVVFGAGGFASGPGGIAAWLTRTPLVIHEQNAIAGMTNRALAHFAKRVFSAFPAVNNKHALKHAECVGNPVRRELSSLPVPAERFANRVDAMRVLIIGGSQGARHLNAVVPQALALLRSHERPQVIHQAGDRHFADTQTRYRELNVNAEVKDFIHDMAAMYAWADLVICRAGALTVSELAAAGLGALLVPFPAAVDDHQTFNAQFLVNAGAALLIQEKDLTPQRLADALHNLLSQGRQHLLQMAERARAQAIVDADVRIADACMQLAGLPVNTMPAEVMS
ncbi:MAG TPA: undecaprenyldiphospho-muramoylpentapeptide beta-N-acetylglucosaminyltransferase [Steroidobacteraceae bacterium]|nr:undecaprenyldiphospho-muramoylpentapeptide beta-N-acetylglucosaminyltransferase [Steroidobacteraceae bacterium]